MHIKSYVPQALKARVADGIRSSRLLAACKKSPKLQSGSTCSANVMKLDQSYRDCFVQRHISHYR